ncbi:type IV secretory system conjugative DNA transfer family protein [Roseibium sp. CAU 1639]|uniref:Type IV secretory system conjugative DNA transfer family protein n=2 Tax=Roseibium sediminicola TaxID=2933272 RepID=A0ABT0H340_9HYPH|nr:type IV secretory system conjugative DNA transfer family protein [Roseibium sp. CAU 1639]MCK7616103.1 type IV secretory system conjugative DNA transfer family protein [Roseibium sp. CAU 1639]
MFGWMIGAMAFGAMLGTLFAVPFIFAFFDQEPGESAWQWIVFGPLIFIGAVFGFQYWRMRSGADVFFGLTGDSHGSARFASRKELKKHQGGDGLLIGRNPGTGRLLRYDGPAHLITLAPTRAGKGVGTVIPNLLAVERSVIVIDPKGENARIAGKARRRFGTVHVLDPFEVSGMPSAAYNPLDRLTSDSLDLGEDAASLTEALVMDPPGQVTEAHWNEEAKAILGGLIMFCVCHEDRDRRSLATVREYLTLPPDRLKALLELMQDSDAAGGLIARAANRFLGKADREAASVLSNAQRHTHFLDSPRIARCLAQSDFAFSDLRHRITSVFLVLPPNRMDAYSRWLRLLVSQALQDIARDAEAATGAPTALSGPGEAPDASPATSGASTAPLSATGRLRTPTLFLLDEFAALGRLEAVERAMGLMAGYGLQLWPILQDMSQLRDLYGDRANTFIANAGVQQVFGVNDFETAKWLSQMIGQETSRFQTDSFKPGDGPSFSNHLTGRDLLTPDEIMQMPPNVQLLRVQGQPSALAQKLRYYADPEFRGLFVPQDAA